MAILNFPQNPIIGDLYEFASYTYKWDGEKWKTISTDSKPTNDFYEEVFPKLDITNTYAIEALRRSYAEAGYTVVSGSFGTGGVLESSTDVLLNEDDGKGYAWIGAFPKTVAPGTDPAAGDSGYVSRTEALLHDQLSSSGGGELLFADKLFKPNSVYASTFLGIPAICATSVWEYANLVTSKPNANDPTTWDWTPAIQAAIDNTPQGGWVSFPDINGWYEFTSIRLKAGVNLTANGKSLYGGTIYFRDAVSQVVSNTLFGMWMKRVFISYTKEVGDTGVA